MITSTIDVSILFLLFLGTYSAIISYYNKESIHVKMYFNIITI